MRIAMMTNTYKPVIGGVPISIERLANGLRKLGHTVYIFAPNCGENGPYDPYVIRCRTLERRLPGDFPIVNVLDSKIERIFRSLHIDIIHVHHPMVMGQAAQYLGRKYAVPVVFTYHTRYEMYLHYLRPYALLERHAAQSVDPVLRQTEESVLQYLREVAVPGFIRYFTNQCDLVFAPTGTMVEYLEDQGVSTPIQIMPTGLPAEAFSQKEELSAQLRRKYLGEKEYLLCTVSRLAKEKNIPFLLRGLAALKRRLGDCFRMLVIGDGPEREALERLNRELGLEENVVFMGFLPNCQIGKYHRACDAFVFASESETQGIVLLEAMAARCPVVAVEASGVRDVVVNGQNGYMTSRDEIQWAARLAQVLENRPLRQALCDGAYRTAGRYRDTSIAQIAEHSYRQVLRIWQLQALEMGFPQAYGRKMIG